MQTVSPGVEGEKCEWREQFERALSDLNKTIDQPILRKWSARAAIRHGGTDPVEVARLEHVTGNVPPPPY
jgi:hypothetical protein